MQKMLTLVVLLCSTPFFMLSQTIVKKHTGQPKHLKAPIPIQHGLNTAKTGFEPLPQIKQTGMPESAEDIIIGNTVYDLQSNASLSQRIVNRFDNGLSASWCMSLGDAAGPYADRGTAHIGTVPNSHAFTSAPTERIENERTGFPTLLLDGLGREHVFAHNGSGQIVHYIKDDPNAAWQAGAPIPHQSNPGGFWVKAAASGNTIHLIYLTMPTGNGGAVVEGMDGKVLYCRSTDGGLTWDIVDARLPGVDSTRYDKISAEEYGIDANGSTVAVGIFTEFGDKLLVVSRNNGQNWTNRVVQDFPFDAWSVGEPLDTNLLLANPDPNAPDPLAFLTGDGSGAVLVDNDGLTHFFYSALYILDNDFSDDQYSIFYGFDAGIHYWNETMQDNSAEIAGFAPDLNGDGTFGGLNGIDLYTEYRYSMCSQPSVGISQNNEIILVYNAPNELDVNLTTSSYFRKPFIVKRLGQVWSYPAMVPNAFNSDLTLVPFQEILYATIARTANDTAYIIAQVDYNQGNNINHGTTDINWINYYPVYTQLLPLQQFLVKGLIYHDENENGQHDAGEQPISGVSVSMNNIYYGKSGHDGIYSMYPFVLGFDTILVHAPSYAQASPSLHIVQPNQNTGYDFGLTFEDDVTDACVALSNSNVFRSGFDTYVVSTVQNPGTLPFDGQLFLVLANSMEYISSSPLPDFIRGDTLIWDLSNFPIFSSDNFSVTVKTPVGTPLGTIIKVEAWVETVNFDHNIQNNYAQLCEPVVGSYDPNDKRCYEGDIFTPQQLADTLPLHYLIRFQNTGTYQADFVRIRDTISENLQLGTLQVLGASHEYEVIFDEDRVVEFFFPNIFLPDSTTNEPESHGFVQYSILPNTDLELGDNIDNTAYIYFDFNPPIITNTTSTEIAELVRVWEKQAVEKLYISPNPATDFIRFDTPIFEKGQLNILDAQGRKVISKNIQVNLDNISVAALSDGTYWVFFQEEKTGKVRVGKFVKN